MYKTAAVNDSGTFASGIHFNPDGTKMFVVYSTKASGDYTHVSEYNLSAPFDVSTKVYASDDQRCILNSGETDFGPIDKVHDLEFSNDGLMLFVSRGVNNSDDSRGDKVFRFDLTSPYDVSTCVFASQTPGLDTDLLQDGSNAGDPDDGTNNNARRKNRLQGFEINDDGTKLFALFHYQDTGTGKSSRLLEYQLSTAFDLSTVSLILDAGIDLEVQATNPKGLRFSPDGKRFWVTDHQATATGQDVTQVSLAVAFSTSSFTIDGTASIADSNDQSNGIAFSAAGLKMYIPHEEDDEIYEYNLVCPFNIIEGKCPSITTGDRTGIAIAQIEVATRTIEHSTDTALNRLKWIRRNKDNQNLTNLNLDLNFTNQMLASLTKVVKTSATTKKKEEKQQDVFYWSEGSIAVGRVGDTNVSSFKKIKTDAITVGVDKFTKNNGISGLAFRFGKNDIDVGSAGSNLDTNTYNLTHYSSSPIEDDTKFIDTVFGVGVLNSDILSVLDGKRVTADRKGRQIYGTIKLKDEIKKNNLILIPSGTNRSWLHLVK